MSVAPGHPLPRVIETLGGKSLSFAGNDIQSSMWILEPDLLELEYTRLMMGFLVFNPRPRRLLLIGLGGGSLAKFCYAYLPQTDITVVEVNPHVIALRKVFAIPDDDARFRVIQDDAALFVAQPQAHFDVVLADGFDASGVPPQLSSPGFYADCHRLVAPAGTLVVNLHLGDPCFDLYVDRLQAAFAQRLTLVQDEDGSNCQAFASVASERARVPWLAMRCPGTMPPQVWNGICSSVARVFLEARSVRRQAPRIAGQAC